MSCGKHEGIERTAHRNRVAYLCARVANILSLDNELTLSLILAARTHTDALPLNDLRNETVGSLTTSVSDCESISIRMAESILCRRSNPKHRFDARVSNAVEILETCDEFDDAIECAVFEGISIWSATQTWFADVADRFSAPILNALRRATNAVWVPQCPDRLPVLPSASAKLIQSSADLISNAELEAVATSDPVLAGRLLGTANSAYFGSSNQVQSIGQAILRLGAPMTHKVLLTASIGTLFAACNLTATRNHSKAVGAIAHELAGECGYDQERAFIGGLLHDIGRLILQSGPSEAHSAEEKLLASGFDAVHAETCVYGTDHAVVGGDLLRSWRLPESIVDGVAHHHRPEATDSVLAGLLYLADEAQIGDCEETTTRLIRRAAACRITGLTQPRIVKRESPLFAIAG